MMRQYEVCIDKGKDKRYDKHMLMDRMGLILPAAEEVGELEIVATAEDERLFDLEIARAVGCITMNSKPDLISQHHIAIYPETGRLTLWWTGLVDLEQKKPVSGEGLVETMKAMGAARIDGLTYEGLYRRPDDRLPFLRRFHFQDSGVENIKLGDKVAYREPSGNLHRSHVVQDIERPSS
jgi:hypothetical protein